jgi:hypothetical protein
LRRQSAAPWRANWAPIHRKPSQQQRTTFSNAAATLNTAKLKSKAPGAFGDDTRIVAPHLGNVSLGSVTTNNGGSVFGVFALAIRSIAAGIGAGVPFKKSNLDGAGQAVAANDFVVELV